MTFGAAAMTHLTDDVWSAEVPAYIVNAPGVEYYIEALDGSPIPNQGLAPAGAPSSLYSFGVGPIDSDPPSIAHTPVPDGQSAGAEVVIQATITDATEVDTATLYYRVAGVLTWTSLPMSASGDVFTATIPGGSVTTAGVQYYLTSSDTLGHLGASPTTAPGAWHAFAVSSLDTVGPDIDVTPVADGQDEGVNVPVVATITDPSDVNAATLFYRPTGFPIFQSVPMSAAGDTYTGTTPGFAVGSAGIEYYVRATDTEGNASTAPSDAPSTVYAFAVGDDDIAPPVIDHSPIADGRPEGSDVAVGATITDASDIAGASVFYRQEGVVDWTEVTMIEGAGTWEATIPGGDVAGGVIYYYLEASDVGGYTATDPSDAPTSAHTFTVVAPDTDAPTIAHTPAATHVTSTVFAVSAEVTDDSALGAVELWWQVDEGVWTSVTMTGTGATYLGDIAAAHLPAGATTLRYYLLASDVLGNSATLPVLGADGPFEVTLETPDTDAPAIALTSIPDGQPAGVAVTVSATVTDASTLSEVTLYAGSDTMVSYVMTAAGDVWTAEIPSDQVVEPGVYYYVTAADEAGNTATAPLDAPGVPAHFTVTAVDGAGPTIVHVAASGPLAPGSSHELQATVTDPSGVAAASVWWRDGTGSFVEVPMVAAGDTYAATVGPVAEPELAYYLVARDALDNSTRAPTVDDYVVPVVAADVAGPTIDHAPVADDQLAAVAVPVSAEVTDASGVASATLYFQAVGDTWLSVAMSAAGDTYHADIPALAVTIAGVNYYIEAEDTRGNVTTDPVEGAAAPHTFSVVELDVDGPTVMLTALEATYPFGSDVPVGATATDPSGVESVTVQWRMADGEWAAEPLTLEGETYVGVLDADALEAGTVELYVEAVDTLDNWSTDPSDGADAPETFEVVQTEEDLQAPTILHSPVTAGTRGDPIAIDAIVTDATGVAWVEVYFREEGSSFLSVDLVEGESGRYSGEIPSLATNVDALEYYLAAVDSAPAENEAVDPVDAPETLHTVTLFSDTPGDDDTDTGVDAGDDTGSAEDTGVDSGANTDVETDGGVEPTEPAPTGESGGCGCASAPARSQLGWWALLGAVILVRRRRG